MDQTQWTLLLVFGGAVLIVLGWRLFWRLFWRWIDRKHWD